MGASGVQRRYGLGNTALLNAECECGFKQTILSGNISEQASLAPYYCERCGLVDLNIRETPRKCPWCKSTKVNGYGSPYISLPQGGEKVYPVLSIVYPAFWRNEYKVYKEGNLCPKCKNMVLVISEEGCDKPQPY